MTQNTHMYNSILALSVADATGENQMKFMAPKDTGYYQAGNVAGMRIPSVRWPWTDDTHLAIGVYRTLRLFGEIHQEELAREFARNYRADAQRGYGKGTAKLLYAFLYDAENWRTQSENWWGPKMGSFGNGSAMRDTIIGAYFGKNLQMVVKNARLSAEVTHFHDEAIAGSIAVAVAASAAIHSDLNQFWDLILEHTPAGTVRDAIQLVSTQLEATNWQIVAQVGNGGKVSALDTVPFALWTAYQAMHAGTFESGVNSIIEVGGDTDTVAAIFGGIVGNTLVVPPEWIERTEPLPEDI